MSLTPFGAAKTESSVTRSANSLPYPNPHVAMESSAACAAAPDDQVHSGLHPGSEPATLPLTNGPPRKLIPADSSTVAVPEADELELDLDEMLTREFGSPNPPNPKPNSRQRSTSRSPYFEKQNTAAGVSKCAEYSRTGRCSKAQGTCPYIHMSEDRPGVPLNREDRPGVPPNREDRPKSRERKKDRTRRPSKSRYHDSAQVPKIDPDLFVNSMLKQQQETEIDKAKSRSLLERNKELIIEKQQVQQQVRESVKHTYSRPLLILKQKASILKIRQTCK